MRLPCHGPGYQNPPDCNLLDCAVFFFFAVKMHTYISRIRASNWPTVDRLIRRPWATLAVASFTLLGMMTAFALVPTAAEKPLLLLLETVREQLDISTNTLIDAENMAFFHEEHVRSTDTIS